eukprot:SAG11_NODE_19415_length_467_cov_0.752717_1_plen_41_part_00
MTELELYGRWKDDQETPEEDDEKIVKLTVGQLKGLIGEDE